MVWLNTLGRAHSGLREGWGWGGADPSQAAALSSGSGLAGGLCLPDGVTGRQNCRKGGTGWSLPNVKHGVGGGFV